MIGRRCPVPPWGQDGGPKRSCPPPTSLPCQQLWPGLLDLPPLRPGTALLQLAASGANAPPTTPPGQPPPPTKSGRAPGPSRPPTRVSAAPPISSRDGCIFPETFLRGQNPAALCASDPESARPREQRHERLPPLCHLRPVGAFRGTVPPNLLEVSMLSNELRAEIRHWFYAEHWKVGTIAQQLGCTRTPSAMRWRPSSSIGPRLCVPC